MDMDSFTEMDSFSKNLAQRTKEREEFLKKASSCGGGGGKSVDDDGHNFGGEKMDTEPIKVVEVKVDGILATSASTPVATVTIKMSDANKENTPKFKYIDDDDDLDTDSDLPPPVPLTSSGVRGLAALRRKRTGSESNRTPSSNDNIGEDGLTQRSIKPQEAAGFQKASPSRIVYEFPEVGGGSKQEEVESSIPVSSLPPSSTTDSCPKEPASPMKIDPKPAPRKSISRAHVMVDKDDPAILPLAVRRALFEAKMRGESLAAQQAIMKTKVPEKNSVSNHQSSEPEAKKSRYEAHVNAECTKSVEDLDDKKANTERNSFSESSDSPNTSQHAEEVIQVCLPKCDYPISPESVNHLPSTSENDVAEALAAFKEIDDISVTSGETTKNAEDKISNPISKNESTSSLSDISSLIEHMNNNESPMGSSTKLYPELPTLEEEFHFDLPKNTAGLRNEFPQLSPIQTVSDEDVSHKTKAVTPRKKTDHVAPSTMACQSPSTPVRTLSMYRREQKMRVHTKEKEEENKFGQALRLEAQKSELLEKYLQYRANKIQELQKEAEKYNNVIFQSLRALELCVQTNNLSERVEAEKILLINTKKKKACVDQIYNLQKDEHHLKNIDLIEILNGPVGKIGFRDLILLVKGDFFVSQVNGNDLYDYHFIALFICGNKVISTDSLSSSHAVQEAALAFSKEILFEELPRNFEIKLEIYALSLPKHKHSHHDRRMVNIRLTPKSKSKSKYTHSPALSASSQKESGVSSSFKLLGYIVLNRENCLKSRFDLINFMYSSPLEGEILMKTSIGAKYDITHKSYLNFQEQSGDFPVWNRRWCLLDGFLIYYWRYSEDESGKQPLGMINLKNCVNSSIQKASTDICMRPHSFVFLTVESKNGKVVYTRHLMAADLKEERDEWLEKFNSALTQTRYWEADAHHPYDDATIERLMK